MKKAILITASIFAIGCLVAMFLLQKQASADAKSDFSGWSPGPAEIRQELGNAANPLGDSDPVERKQAFRKLFEKRFRSQTPMMAVGINFLDEKKIKLMCPARMEPWNMDAIAMMTWREAKDILGKSYEIDIYQTYLGGAFVKVGELRMHKNDPNIANISYSNYSFPKSRNANVTGTESL